MKKVKHYFIYPHTWTPNSEDATRLWLKHPYYERAQYLINNRQRDDYNYSLEYVEDSYLVLCRVQKTFWQNIKEVWGRDKRALLESNPQ
jgi:hypothetical protein